MRRKVYILAAVFVISTVGFACGQMKEAEETSAQITETSRQETEAADQTSDTAKHTTTADEQTGKADEPEAKVPGSSATEISKETYEDNFSVDSAASSAFGKAVKEAVAAEDLEALADLVSFPVYVGFTDGGSGVGSREEFIALGAERIFTQEMKDSIAGADETDLSPSMAGFVLQSGDGPNIIFGVVNGKLGIVGVNY